MSVRDLVILVGAACCGVLSCWSSGDRGRSGTAGSSGGDGVSCGGVSGGGGGASGGGATAWVGTWACGPQLTESGNNPPAPGLSDNTLRQVVFSSIGGNQLRLRLSNEFGDGPVTMNAVHVALSAAAARSTPAATGPWLFRAPRRSPSRRVRRSSRIRSTSRSRR
jgi:hypothetical protein